ncbi:hypothetical protein HA402_011977 [Bradysia odoriphaga]|nr:hypothetical protein HA402_011977 [Bradysia odoriphaga]
MKDKSCGKVGDDLLLELWTNRLPQQIQAILSCSTAQLEQQVILADKIYETIDHTSINALSHHSDFTKQICKLEEKIDSLQKDINRSRSHPRSAKSKIISRLYVKEKNSGRNYLIDTGADISVIPPNSNEKGHTSCNFTLHAANGSQIKTYGSKSVTLNLGLRRNIRWIFVIADVQQPIIGSDLLQKFDLLVDIKNNKLIDNLTSLSTNGIKVQHDSDISVKVISNISIYHQLVNEFPDLLDMSTFRKSQRKHNVKHRIITNCPPLFSKARRLNPEKTKIAKKEFDEMQSLGICRPSNSPWATPLHMTPKPSAAAFV